jgi:O-antigen ligase
MFDWAIEWTWLGVQLIAALFWFFVWHHKFKPTAGLKPSAWLLCFILFTVSGMLGTLYSSFVMGLQIDSKDLLDHMRFLIFVPLALFIGSAIDQCDIDGFTLAVKMVVLFNLLTAVILLMELPVLSTIVMNIYGDAKVQYEFGHIRIGIPFTNPNFAALFFVLAFAYFTSFKISPLFAALSLSSLFLTGSRSGLISAAPILLLSYFYFLRNALSNRKVLVIFAIIHAIPLYYIANILEAAEGLSRIVELADSLKGGNIGQVETANIRFDVVNNAIEYIKKSPVFGIGPGRFYGLDITDSQLIAWPLMYGIPCAIFISGFFAFIFLNVAINAKVSNHAVGVIAIFLSFFLMLSTGDFMKNYRLFFITILFAHVIKMISVENISKKQKVSNTFLRQPVSAG